MIHSLAKYFDAKGITSQMIDDYVKLIGAQGSEDSDSESDYSKLFTTHKYQVIEDLASQNSYPIPSVKQPSVTKTISAPIEVNQGSLASSIVQEIVTPTIPHPEKKRGRPSQKDKEKEKEKKEVLAEEVGPDGVKKKRKNKKKDEEAKSNTPQHTPTMSTPNMSMNPMFNAMQLSGISPAKDSTSDKVRKFEETISKYEDFTQGRDQFDMVMQNIPGLKNIVKGMGLDSTTIRTGNPQPTALPGAYHTSTDYSKILQEMLKMTNSTGNLLGDKNLNPGHNNYFPDNFKNM